MALIRWTYDYMYKWYAKHYNPDAQQRDVFAFVYETKKPVKKDETKVEPFISRNIVVIEKQNISVFKHGLFTLMDLTSAKKWLFFVHPEEKTVDNHTFLYGDHYTFCFDQNDKKTPVHFHSTNYIPTVVQPFNRLKHVTDHQKDFFPDELDIARQGDVPNIIKNSNHADVKPLVLQLMRRPWATTSGGAKKPTTTPYVARAIQSQAFCYQWATKGYKAMFAFGLRQNGRIIWSVRCVEKGREKKNHVYQAYHFTTSTSNELEFQNTLANLL